MARLKLIRTSDFPYHVYNRYNNKAPSTVSPNVVWRVYAKYLYAIYCIYNVRIHAFVMMGNHYHLIVSTPDKNIDQAMQYFHTFICRALNQASQSINHQFGGRYRWSVIHNLSYVRNVLRYVYLNPVKAGLCERAEQYPWSSLSRLLGDGRLSFPVAPLTPFSEEIPVNPIELADFVNIDFPDDLYYFAEKALQSPIFKFKNRRSKSVRKMATHFEKL